MRVQKIAGVILIVFAIVFVLVTAQGIIVPIVLAIFSWFLIKEIRDFFNRISWIKNYIPRWIKTLSASVILLFVFGLFANLLFNNIQNLSKSLQAYEGNLIQISKSIESFIGINLQTDLASFTGDIDFKSGITNILNSITDLLSNSFMIILYLIFILLEESTFIYKMKAIYPKKEKYNRINEILLKIDKSVGRYISIKTLISGLTATLSYIILRIIDIDSALFFAFVIFILNFIPSIGSLIATIFPALMALLQYGDTTYTPFLLVILFVGTVQMLVGNFLEPKLMGNSLNISSLVVILSLTVWGAIWGIIGMVLSVPITVILIIVLSNFESTRNIAILLSERGRIDVGE